MAEGCVMCRGYRARYYAPSRLILRRQMEIKRRQDAAARLAERRNKAAKRIQVHHRPTYYYVYILQKAMLPI
jgi:hypothetical protein